MLRKQTKNRVVAHLNKAFLPHIKKRVIGRREATKFIKVFATLIAREPRHTKVMNLAENIGNGRLFLEVNVKNPGYKKQKTVVIISERK